jgi:transposase
MELKLSAAERKELVAAMRQAASVRLFRRLQAVLLAAEGRAAKEIAVTVGVSRRSVTSWVTTYRARARRRRPAQLLAPKANRGRVPDLPELTRERLLVEVNRDPLALGYAATNWTVALLAGHLRRLGLPVSERTLRRRMRAAGLRWKRPRYAFAPPEPARAQKKAGWCAA